MPLSMPIELTFDVAKGDELYLVFNVTRGKPVDVETADKVGVEVLPEPPPGELRRLSLPRNVLCLRSTQPLAKGQELRVVSEVEAVELTKVIHVVPGTRVHVYTVDEEGKLPGKPAPIEAQNLGESLRGEILDAAGYLKEAGDLLKDVAAFREYFWELDRGTHPDLTRLVAVDGEARTDAINLAIRILRERLIERARRKKRNGRKKAGEPLIPLPTSVRPDDVPCLKHLSELQLGLIRKHFAVDTTDGLKRFERAYEMFANGELGLYLPKSGAWTCEPSSGYYFLFGEFALLAVDPGTPLAAALGADRFTWMNLCNVLVRTQEIFARVYAPKRGSKQDSFEHFAAANYWHRRRPLSPREKQDLEKVCAGSTLGQLCDRSAGYAIEYLPGAIA